MRKLAVIAMLAMLALSGCCGHKSFGNQYVCEIEYMDGEKERIKCYHARDDSPVPVLIIEIYKGGRKMRKSLATIKRWRLIKLEKPES